MQLLLHLPNRWPRRAERRLNDTLTMIDILKEGPVTGSMAASPNAVQMLLYRNKMVRNLFSAESDTYGLYDVIARMKCIRAYHMLGS